MAGQPVDPELRRGIAELMAELSEAGESGLWCVIQEDTELALEHRWAVRGPYNGPDATIELQRLRDAFGGEPDMAGVRIHLARFTPETSGPDMRVVSDQTRTESRVHVREDGGRWKGYGHPLFDRQEDAALLLNVARQLAGREDGTGRSFRLMERVVRHVVIASHWKVVKP